MATALSRHLAGIENGLRRLGRERTISLMHAGIPAAEVDAALYSVGLASSDQLRAWFAWHNGTDGGTLGELAILPGYHQSSLGEVVASYRAFQDDPRWRRGWIPLLADGGGDFLVLDQSVGEEPWPVREFVIDEAEAPVEYVDVEAFAATVADAYAAGLFTDQPGYLSIAGRADDYARLAAGRNPGVAWWTE